MSPLPLGPFPRACPLGLPASICHAAHLSPKAPVLPPWGPRSAPPHGTTLLTKEYTAFYSHAAASQNTNTRQVPHRNSPPCASWPPEPTARLVPSWVGSPRPCSLPSNDTVTALTMTRGLGSSPLFSGSPPWPLPMHQDRSPRTPGFPKTPGTRLALHHAPRWLPSPESLQVLCS